MLDLERVVVCIICDKKDRLIASTNGNNHYIECARCGTMSALFGSVSAEEAIKAWNKSNKQ